MPRGRVPRALTPSRPAGEARRRASASLAETRQPDCRVPCIRLSRNSFSVCNQSLDRSAQCANPASLAACSHGRSRSAAAGDHLILPSLYSTCLRAAGRIFAPTSSRSWCGSSSSSHRNAQCPRGVQPDPDRRRGPAIVPVLSAVRPPCPARPPRAAGKIQAARLLPSPSFKGQSRLNGAPSGPWWKKGTGRAGSGSSDAPARPRNGRAGQAQSCASVGGAAPSHPLS